MALQLSDYQRQIQEPSHILDGTAWDYRLCYAWDYVNSNYKLLKQ